jgi:hypothetical protein
VAKRSAVLQWAPQSKQSSTPKRWRHPTALAEEDIRFTKAHLGEWLAEQSRGKPPAVYELELRERMVRVEEELKHQRELMRQALGQVEKRLEQIDKRFDEMLKRHDRRFLGVIGFIATSAGLVTSACGCRTPRSAELGGRPSRPRSSRRYSRQRCARIQPP